MMIVLVLPACLIKTIALIIEKKDSLMFHYGKCVVRTLFYYWLFAVRCRLFISLS